MNVKSGQTAVIVGPPISVGSNAGRLVRVTGPGALPQNNPAYYWWECVSLGTPLCGFDPEGRQGCCMVADIPDHLLRPLIDPKIVAELDAQGVTL